MAAKKLAHNGSCTIQMHRERSSSFEQNPDELLSLRREFIFQKEKVSREIQDLQTMMIMQQNTIAIILESVAKFQQAKGCEESNLSRQLSEPALEPL